MIKTTIHQNGAKNEWKKINIITGANGVGKTQFIKNITSYLIDSENGLIGSDLRKAEYLFSLSNKRSIYTKILNREIEIHNYNKFKQHAIFDQSGALIKYGGGVVLSGNNFGKFILKNAKAVDVNEIILEEINRNFANLEDRIINFYNKMMNSLSTRFIDNDGLINDPEYNKHSYVKMKKIIDSFLSGKFLKGISGDGRKIIISDIDGKEVGVSSLSKGEKQIFALFSRLLEVKNEPNLYIWDEPETHLNPSWQRKIIPFFYSVIHEDSNAFIATHSLDIINSREHFQSKLFELKRDVNGPILEPTNIFDSKVLSSEFFDGFGIFANDIEKFNNFVIVEGITDKIYIEKFFPKAFVINAEGAGNLTSVRDALRILKPNSKIILIYDNDIDELPKKQDTKITKYDFAIVYQNLKEGSAIEKLFVDLLDEEIEYKNNTYLIKKDANIEHISSKVVPETAWKFAAESIIKKIGFIDSSKFSHSESAFPSKMILAEYLVNTKLNEIKGKLESTIKTITDFFSK